MERPFVDGSDAVGDRHARQPSATVERTVADLGETAGDGHARQAPAPIERLEADGGDAAGESYARQTTAPLERKFSDGGNWKTVNCVWDNQVTNWSRITISDCNRSFFEFVFNIHIYY